MDWFYGHSMEIAALSVLGALAVRWPIVAVLAVGAAVWWVVQEWRVAQLRTRPTQEPRALETGRARERERA